MIYLDGCPAVLQVCFVLYHLMTFICAPPWKCLSQSQCFFSVGNCKKSVSQACDFGDVKYDFMFCVEVIVLLLVKLTENTLVIRFAELKCCEELMGFLLFCSSDIMNYWNDWLRHRLVTLVTMEFFRLLGTLFSVSWWIQTIPGDYKSSCLYVRDKNLHLYLIFLCSDIPLLYLPHDLRPHLDSYFLTTPPKTKQQHTQKNKTKLLEEAIPGSFSMEFSLPSHNPLQPGIIQRSSLSVSAFFRDLPPQSHKSTEDRCLLCLIKALPPGVIPQFEQEEKPSEGGNVLDQSYEGPILYTLI